MAAVPILRLKSIPPLPQTKGPPRSVAPACAIFRTFLRRKKLKFTRERAAVLDAILRMEGLFAADAVAEDLQASGRAGSRATVYRTLTHLQEAGLLRQVLFDGSRHALFEVVADPAGPRQPSDYLIDADTGEVLRIESPELRQARDELCRRLGFEPVRHSFHVFARRSDRTG